jgi:hypothetical protein
MSRSHRTLLTILVAASLGLFLAHRDRHGRDTANAGGTPGPGQTVGVAQGEPWPEPKQQDTTPVALLAGQPKREEPAVPRVEAKGGPNADLRPAEDPTLARKAAYVKIVAALDGVEAAAVKKYGRKPRPDDKAEFAIPYKAFVNAQTQRVRKQLATDLGLSEAEVDQIKAEGDKSGWARQ